MALKDIILSIITVDHPEYDIAILIIDLVSNYKYELANFLRAWWSWDESSEKP